jgi:hypothetical protein
LEQGQAETLAVAVENILQTNLSLVAVKRSLYPDWRITGKPLVANFRPLIELE